MSQIISLLKTNCTGIDCNVVWYVEQTAHATVLRIADQEFYSLINWFSTSKVWIMLPIIWWILSRITLDCGFCLDEGLASMSYSCLIRCWNLLPINLEPWSYVILICHGYHESHAISTLLAITSAVLVSDWIKPSRGWIYHSNCLKM
jgi:hypothetical protein